MPWPVHPTGFFGARGDSDTYRIERSLRFNSADSAYLNRTPSSIGDNTTWTFSCWVKRSLISSRQAIFVTSNSGGTDYVGLEFLANDKLAFNANNGSVSEQFRLETNAVFRDTSAWYHIVCFFNTGQSTSSNRAGIYINGVSQTYSTATYMPLNYNGRVNSTNQHNFGTWLPSASLYFGGYITECYLIDGQALTPSSFGETDAITGRWKAKPYGGTYGTNGFYLKFADNSGTTSTTLGKDSSGNGNNWTPNNFSVTAGTGNDSLVDSPTNYGTDTGLGGEVRGNYATLNPLSITSGSFVQGNLRYTGPSGWRRANGTIAVSAGKWYWEVTLGNAPAGTTSGGAYNGFGFGDSSVFNSSVGAGSVIDAIVLSDNQHYKNFSGSATSLGTSFASGDVLGCAVDLGANTFTFYRNGSQLVTGTIGGTAGRELVPIIISYDGTYGVMDCNFGQRPFAYAAPSGFKALCTQNLPQPTIQKPSKYMDALAYTGTGASNSISSLGFSPDLVWIKNRGTTTDHALYDILRGAQAQISSNTTGSEVTSSSGLTAFGSAGFTIGTSSLVNTSGTQYVAWSWDAGSTNSTNTSGSITSTIRTNPQAGFSIVSFTAPNSSSPQTVGHGLGVAPKMFFVKARSSSGNWNFYHSSLGATKYLFLNTTDAEATNSNRWNNTAPTSSVITLGSNFVPDASTTTYIAYCFAEIEGYSKFGSYTGNGSSDGPFVFTGHRPRWMLIKRTDGGTDSWFIWDTARNQFNVSSSIFRAESSNAEASVASVDILSNGFKLRDGGTGTNASGATYIFAAFAEAPFKYARAR